MYALAMLAAWFTAEHFGIPGTYGVSLAAVGMLSITGMIVSADAYGPIVDNANLFGSNHSFRRPQRFFNGGGNQYALFKL